MNSKNDRNKPQQQSKMLLPIITFAVLVSTRPAAATAAAQPSQTCQRRCGTVDIPYPFGIGRGCYLYTGEGDLTFGLTCNLTADGTYRPFTGDLEVLDVSLLRGQARIRNQISSWCYNDTSRSMDEPSGWWTDLSDSSFMFSDTDNKFTVIGCNTLAYIGTVNESEYTTGCVSMCPRTGRLEDGSCTGVGCCQTAIPRGLNSYVVSFDDRLNSSRTSNLSRCRYTVLVEAVAFEFQTAYVSTSKFMDANGGLVPLVLDWVVGKESCREAKRNATAYACVSSNSECVGSRNGPGYLCNCSKGYQGNPYLLDGCRDINECEDKRLKYPCSVPGTCINTPGGFHCSCPANKRGNAFNGTCEAIKSQLGWQIALGISIGVVILVVSMSCAYMIHEKKRVASIKRRYFKQHGGLLLFEEMKSKQGLSFKLFTKEELEEATNKFDERNVLGNGGNGTVYKGVLKDSSVVAIKKCKLIDERQKKQFGKEMLILSQINHRNIVRLQGCCLEVQVPMLVYEFILNGTLYQLIHGKNYGSRSHISFNLRMKIAHEVAEALAYLHSWALPPVIHGDVKSSNILLDENYTAKVSDFGASTLAPTDEAQFVTFVQGTYGYLDPEYMQTSKLTDKSDVYSFGVVLLELLTCKKAINLDLPEEETNLSSHFLIAERENRLEEVLDDQIKNEESIELLEMVAQLAKECLEMSREKRPIMREVAEEIDRLRKLSQHLLEQHTFEEVNALLCRSPDVYSKFELNTNYANSTDTAYLRIRSP